MGDIHFTNRRRGRETLQPGSECDNFKPRLKSGIFKCLSRLTSSFLVFLADGDLHGCCTVPSTMQYFTRTVPHAYDTTPHLVNNKNIMVYNTYEKRTVNRGFISPTSYFLNDREILHLQQAAWVGDSKSEFSPSVLIFT
jgi:hypothetical protein